MPCRGEVNRLKKGTSSRPAAPAKGRAALRIGLGKNVVRYVRKKAVSSTFWLALPEAPRSSKSSMPRERLSHYRLPSKTGSRRRSFF